MTSGYRRPDDAAALAHNFRVFADADCASEPLYAALSRAIADNDRVLATLMLAPYPQRRPVLLFAATHDLLLAGTEHPLAWFYPDVVASDALRVDIENVGAVFSDFCDVHRPALLDLIATRTVQTNEVGRSAGLWLALASLAGKRPIALIDVGCSAGLNLLVDRFRLEYRMPGASTRAEGPESAVVIRATIVGGAPFHRGPAAMPPIAQRVGIDLAPLDVHDDRDARWLRACVWPSESDRQARLGAAIALARTTPLELRRGDATEQLASVVAALDDDIRPVVFHSWVVSYFGHAGKLAFVDAVRALVLERDGAWISAEGPNVVPGLAPPPLPDDADTAIREATIWHLTTRDHKGAASRVIARTHPHCRWIDWLA